jgi:hypothetical protein
MSQMRWFRMHTEARTDRKLDTLTDDQFRVWFNLLCMAAESDERGTVVYEDDTLLSLEVASGDPELLRHALSRLVTLRIIESRETRITFLNFQKRQYAKPSDMPEQTRDRQAKSRLNRVTARDSRDSALRHTTDTDTDTEKNIPKDTIRAYSAEFESFWRASWKAGSKWSAFQRWKRLTLPVRSEASKALPDWTAFYSSADFVQHVETWLNKRMWETDIPRKSSANGHTVKKVGTDEEIASGLYGTY